MIQEAHLSFRKTHCKTDLFQSLVDKATVYLCTEALSKTLYYWNKKNVGLALIGFFLHSFFI